MTSTLTPAALAEIRERDATCTRCGMPGDGAYPIIPVTGEHADWHICALALYHASIAKDATISRLSAELAAKQSRLESVAASRSAMERHRDSLALELAAARKPQELPKPTDDDIFEAWCDDANAALVRKEDAGEPTLDADPATYLCSARDEVLYEVAFERGKRNGVDLCAPGSEAPAVLAYGVGILTDPASIIPYAVGEREEAMRQAGREHTACYALYAHPAVYDPLPASPAAGKEAM